MRTYFVLILTAICMAFVTGYIALFLQGSYQATEADILEINNIKLAFQKSVDPVTIINFNNVYYSNEQLQLVNPIYSMPDARTDGSVNYYSSGDCFKGFGSLLNQQNFEKVWVWEEFRCGGRTALPRNFFIEPPYMHPVGKSYAYLAHMLGKSGHDHKSWVLNHLPYFHASELKEIKKSIGELRGVFRILERLSDGTLDELSKGKGTILTNDFLLARLNYPRIFNILEYRVYGRESLDDFLRESPYVLHNHQRGRGCFYRDGSLCWDYNVKHIFRLANKSTIALFLGLIVIITLVVRVLLVRLKQQRFEDEKRRLALRVLTHEFRTPITSMLLLTERLSKRYDQMDPEIQEMFLRLSNEVYRLQRLTETSQNYLKAKQHKRLLEFKCEEIPSLNDFVDEIVFPYVEKYPDGVVFEPLENDIPVNLDVYWTSICIKNLVENAIHHGAVPVVVRLFANGKKIEIAVIDAGEVEFDSIEEMTGEFVKGNKSEGTGLGLNIVYRVIREMDGDLKLTKNPTTFTLVLPNKKERHE